MPSVQLQNLREKSMKKGPNSKTHLHYRSLPSLVQVLQYKVAGVS